MTRILPIKDFPDYFVDDEGNVYSKKYHHTLNKYCELRKIKPEENNGYLRVGLHKNNRQFQKNVHRLVAETFIPNLDNKPQINHKNGMRNDNRVSNLEWVTSAENIKHAFKVLHRKGSLLGKTGSTHPCAKKVLQIKGDKIIAEFGSIRDAERKTQIGCVNISYCCRGIQKTAGGYGWKYKQ